MVNCRKRISICSWKAFFNCLPVDDRVQKVGILMASKCDCCSRGHREYVDLVLSRGEVASKV